MYGSRRLAATAQESLANSPRNPRGARERAAGVRGDHQWGVSGASAREAWLGVALDTGALPGAGNGQELDLPAHTQRGDPKREAGSLHQGQALRPRRILGEQAPPTSCPITDPDFLFANPLETDLFPELYHPTRLCPAILQATGSTYDFAVTSSYTVP